MFKVTCLTIFPEMLPGPLGYSLAGKALKNGIWNLEIVNIRDFGITRHQNVDDIAYGGGHGLIMRPDVLGNALDHTIKLNPDAKIYYPSPRGKLFDQANAKALSKQNNIIIICGRFEGIDERIIEEYNVEQISVGNYVLSGGEVATITILDSVIRLLPGVLSNQETLFEESFEKTIDGLNLLEHPLYTKPAMWRGRKVPEVLLSGNHQLIEDWKMEKSIEITKLRSKT
ncbi:MAG: tRNA (guanosine(37)-N1)-methyltransferase TrmD [Rickettsiaceae bacterium]|nr:tRNA (guanosine(37)-N1)-methyltransferase TrmD [Rickettsiaceae bacterium]